MGGTYLSKRQTVSQRQERFLQSPAGTGPWTPVLPALDRNFTARTLQETTSYRSRGRLGDIELDNDELSLGAILDKSFRAPKFDKGHPFSTINRTISYGFSDGGSVDLYKAATTLPASPAQIQRIKYIEPSARYTLNGVQRRTNDLLDPSWFFTTSDIVMGNRAIAACAPTRPVSSLTRALGELLLDGLPSVIGISLLKDRASSFRSIGKEYLNVQFGWVPFISEIISIVNALINATTILDNYQKGSGQQTRRRWNLPLSQETRYYTGSDLSQKQTNIVEINPNSESFGRYDAGGLISLATAPADQQHVSIRASRMHSFSGAFTYVVPEAGTPYGDFSRFLSLADKLLGVKLTPEVIWQLAPWSWMVDWVVMLGSNISSAQRFQSDDLVLRYGYLMVEDRINLSADFTVQYTSVSGSKLRNAFYRQTLVQKRRIKSTPFGFGLNPQTNFSSFQWSILAALGMTKAPRTLR